MGQDKEKLKKLILLIDELLKVEGNEWFGQELFEKLFRKKIDSSTPIGNELIGLINHNVESIHKYLTLDVIPILDYSSIPDERVRNQLFRDCLEMGKYRLGKINDEINFDEFCKYAHLQAEELLNYYYIKVFGDLEKIILAMKSYNEKYKGPTYTINSISQIDYSAKLIAFHKKFNFHFTLKDVLIKIKDLRNEQSHRSTLSEKNEIFYLDENEKVKNKPYNIRSENEREIARKAELIIFKRKSDFDNVYLALDQLKILIISNIIK